MAKIYKGEEKKFAIELTAPGFSMDDDDFEIKVEVPKGSVKGYKNPPAGTEPDVLIFKETETNQVTDPDSGETTEETTGTWYAIIDTSKLPGTGEMKVVATAYVPDTNANDGIRKTIAVGILGTLSNP